MKKLSIAMLLLFSSSLFAQTVEVQQPVEERYPINSWWWVLGVAITIGIGIMVYLLIKKDPRKDAVR